MNTVTLHEGDNRDSIRRLIDQGVRVHSVVTDPPYGLVSVQKRFGKEGSAPARTTGNDGSFARLSGGFMGKCFHPDTEILTASGWMKVDEIEVGDIVATLNPISRSTEWQAVAQTHAYPFDGELVHVKHRSAEQMITPNHKALVSHDGGESLELLTPRELKKSFHLFAQSAPQTGRNDDVVIRSVREYGKNRAEYRKSEARFAPSAFFRFFGLWLGDGYSTTRTNDHPANDYFGITVRKKRKVDAVRSALLDLGIKFTESPATSGFTTFYCYDFALLGWLKLLGGAKEKRIPTFLFDWDAAHLEHLYQGLMDSDGCRQGKNQEVFQTSSKQLADDFQRLCFATGRSCAITLRQGGKDVVICGHKAVSSDAWVCCVLQQGKRMYGENSTTRSNVLHSVPYAGDVFCVGVPEHHIIYTRFNGKPVWSGNSWDGSGIERDPEFWALIYEILLPGGYVFAFSGSRTGHWQAVAMELAGFIMHPMHGWTYGSGFPKAHAADKAIDKMLKRKGDVIAHGDPVKRMIPGADQHRNGSWIKDNGREYQPGQYVPATEEAAQWEGWAYGTQSQKPALEPIYLGQKPFSEKTGAANLLKHGVGAVNIDATRVPLNGSATYGCSAHSSLLDSKVCTCLSHVVTQTGHNEDKSNQVSSSLEPCDLDDLLSSGERHVRQAEVSQGFQSDCQIYHHCDDEPVRVKEVYAQDASTSQVDVSILPVRCAKCGCIRENLSKPYLEDTAPRVENKGRHPANLLLDGSPEVVAMFPDSKSTGGQASLGAFRNGDVYGKGKDIREKRDPGFGDSGSAARFFHHFPPDMDPLFYHPKAGKADRAGSKHPTVKPIALMQYLIRHITPPGGVVLDPFAGSGTTAEAARREGFDCILMEAEPEYVEFLKQRFSIEDDADELDELFDGYSTECGLDTDLEDLL